MLAKKFDSKVKDPEQLAKAQSLGHSMKAA